MRIDMSEIGVGDGSVLAGVDSGRAAFARLIAKIVSEAAEPEIVFLDFSRVTVATASFLRECVLAFRDAVRGRRSNYYPVLADANKAIFDELSVLTAGGGDVVVLCSFSRQGIPQDWRILGELDPKRRVTFDLVQRKGETDATALMAECGADEGIQQNAWNNRLADLSTLGLVIETSSGRSKRYRALFKEN